MPRKRETCNSETYHKTCDLSATLNLNFQAGVNFRTLTFGLFMLLDNPKFVVS